MGVVMERLWRLVCRWRGHDWSGWADLADNDPARQMRLALFDPPDRSSTCQRCGCVMYSSPLQRAWDRKALREATRRTPVDRFVEGGSSVRITFGGGRADAE